MAVWQITKNNEPTTDPLFDDTNPGQPGDPTFTTAVIVAHVATLGAGYGFNYVGQSPGQPTPQ